jgi:hypothetical protein
LDELASDAQAAQAMLPVLGAFGIIYSESLIDRLAQKPQQALEVMLMNAMTEGLRLPQKLPNQMVIK